MYILIGGVVLMVAIAITLSVHVKRERKAAAKRAESRAKYDAWFKTYRENRLAAGMPDPNGPEL